MKWITYMFYRLNVFLNFKFNCIKSKILADAFFKHGEKLYFAHIGKLKNPQFISIGNNVIFGDYIFLTAWKEGEINPQIQIGNNCSFGAFNHISGCNSIIIGNNVLTGKNVTIVDNCHGDTTLDDLLLPPLQRPIRSKGAIVIEDDVWIGDKATILQNVRIGKGAVIAANAVVTKDVPSYSIVAGVPSKVLKIIK